MSPVYCSSAVDRDPDIASRVRVRDEPGTTLGYFDAVERQKGLLPDACYRKLVEQLPAVVYIDTVEESDPALYMSPQVEEMLGYAPEEWLSDPELWLKLLHPEDRDRVLSVASRVRSTGESFKAEYRLIARDGLVVWVRDEAVCVETQEIDCPAAWQGIMLDITERKKAEEEIEASEKLFSKTFEAAGVGMAHIAPDGSWLRINGRLAEITGYSREELLAMSFQEITHPDDLEKDQEKFRRLIVGEIETYSIEKRYVRKDGRRIWGKKTISSLRDGAGEIVCLVSVIEETTERKLAELLPDPLTPLELEILALVARWQTNTDIARRLAYSHSSVKSHVHSILAKLGVGSRRQAAIIAVDIGLIPPPR